MWECYYCGSSNEPAIWFCDRCNAPKKIPIFKETPGYEPQFEASDMPYFCAGTSMPASSDYFWPGGVISRSWRDEQMSDNVARYMTEPEGCYVETVPITNYKSSKSAYLRLVDWMKGKIHNEKET
jgi:hypothetical protein